MHPLIKRANELREKYDRTGTLTAEEEAETKELCNQLGEEVKAIRLEYEQYIKELRLKKVSKDE